MVWLNAWPICRMPVRLGGGSWIENDGLGWIGACGKVAARFPERRPARFDRRRVETLGEILV